MNVAEIRRLARELGLANTAKTKRGELIRQIQRAEGNFDCYASLGRFDCQQTDCLWRKNCLSSRPG